jgi:4-hydroxy-tetrahydrodipicolinate synthase
MSDFPLPHGIIPAMVTPLTGEGKVNEPSLRRLTRRLIEAGVHGLFTIGSQGEFWALTEAEKRDIWRIVVEETAGRVPVYAGTAAVTTREAIQLTRAASDCGVDSVSILTPFFLAPTDDELYRHYADIAQSTDLPILLYANPARTGVSLSVALVARLAALDNIVGIKDSSGQMPLTAAYIDRHLPGFSVLMGNDALIYAALTHGAQGAVAATANVIPEIAVRIYESYQAGDLEASREAQALLAPLRQAFGWGTFPVVIKEALNLMGEDAGPAHAPVGPMTDAERERLHGVLQAMGAIPA